MKKRTEKPVITGAPTARDMDAPTTVTELTPDQYDRLLKGRIRELEAVMEKYCYCRHGSFKCSCTAEARAVMFKGERDAG